MNSLIAINDYPMLLFVRQYLANRRSSVGDQESKKDGIMRKLAKAGVVVAAAGMAAGIALSSNASASSASTGKSVHTRSEQVAPMASTRTKIGHQSKTVSPDKAHPHVGTAAISSRMLWCGISGDFQLNLNGLGVYDGQPVAVTVVQADTGGGEFFGTARMRVNNVRVWGGAVTTWVTVEWGEPLCIYTHYVAV